MCMVREKTSSWFVVCLDHKQQTRNKFGFFCQFCCALNTKYSCEDMTSQLCQMPHRFCFSDIPGLFVIVLLEFQQLVSELAFQLFLQHEHCLIPLESSCVVCIVE